MTEFRDAQLRRLDLTVLLVFVGLMRHRKAARVAADLGLTQSAISHALGRLRDVFGDPLFLRRPHGLEPTAVAGALEAPVREAVEALRAALGGAAPYDPMQERGAFRISASDSEQALLLPGLVARMSEEAPQSRLSIRALPRAAAAEALIAGDIDVALGVFWDLPEALIGETLFEEGYAVAGAEDTVAGGLDLDRYVALPHVLVSPSGDLAGIVDEALERLGLRRRVVAVVPQFFAAFAVAAETGALATLPARLCRRHAGRFGLRAADPPIALRRFTVSVVRHRRNERDGRTGWLLSAIRDTVAGIGKGGAGSE
jgi:DNA-binding transcriptional LysR family regulator